MMKIVNFRRRHERQMIAGMFAESEKHGQSKPRQVGSQMCVDYKAAKKNRKQIGRHLFHGVAVNGRDCNG